MGDPIGRGWSVDASRGEPRFLSETTSTYTADLRNPSDSIAYTTAPVAIRIGFKQGECPSADYLTVRDDTGAEVPFQWEGATRPYDNADMSTWPDTSLRAGNLWVMASLSGGQTKRYTVTRYGSAQGHSFTQGVTYTAVSGTVDELATGTNGVICRFESGQAWNLRRYQDKSNANFDLFSGVQGVFGQYQISSGVGKTSYTAGDVSSVSHGRLNTSAFGYGVVFQDYEAVWTWTAEPTLTERMRYRVFADGSVQIEKKASASGAIASAAKQMNLQLTAGATGLTSTFDSAHFYKEHAYASSRFLFGYVLAQVQHEAWAGESWTLSWSNVNAQTLAAGHSGTTAINSGAQYRHAAFLTRYAVSDAANEWQRRINPIRAFASVAKPISDLAAIARYSREMAADALPVLLADANKRWHGVAGLLTILRDGYGAAATALGLYQQWCAQLSITPTTASTYYAAWNTGSAGIEFQGRNTQVLWWLRQAYISSGDATNQALVESYIHAFADAVVSMEAASGSGLLKLNAAGADTYNARTAGMSGLAASLAITSNATRQATLDRLSSGYNAAAFAGVKWAYSPGGTYLQLPTIHYYGFQTFELLRAKRLLPSLTLPAGDLAAWVREAYQPGGLCDEWRHNYQLDRRGAASTAMYGAACLALQATPDDAAAQELARHISFDFDITTSDLDGFSSMGAVVPLNIVMDVRALAEVVLARGA